LTRSTIRIVISPLPRPLILQIGCQPRPQS
jgi:hypothetical protein